MNREKIIEKIRKCLALGRSPNEHEAAAALRQAQKLMRLHGIDELEVGEEAYTQEVVPHREYKYGRRKPLIIASVINLMAEAFGVEPTWTYVRAGQGLVHGVIYFGPRARVLLAAHAHVVVYRAATAAWRAYTAEHPDMAGRPGARAGFYLGWCEAVREKVEALAPTDEEREGTQRAVERYVRREGRELADAKTGSKKIYTHAADTGKAMGADFDLHRPVSSEHLRLENKGE